MTCLIPFLKAFKSLPVLAPTGARLAISVLIVPRTQP
jgi:hypothetical protein